MILINYDVYKMEVIDAPDDSQIIWSGSPNLMVYLLSCRNCGMGLLCAAISLYFIKLGFPILTIIVTLLALLKIVLSVVECVGIRYFITSDGAICKYKGKYFLSRWSEINPAGFKLVKKPFDSIFGLGTVKINTIYGNTTNHNNNDIFQRRRGVFWGIKDYEKVYSVVQGYLNNIN